MTLLLALFIANARCTEVYVCNWHGYEYSCDLLSKEEETMPALLFDGQEDLSTPSLSQKNFDIDSIVPLIQPFFDDYPF